MNRFTSLLFNYCFSHGYGVRGIYDQNLSFTEAYEIIKDHDGLEMAEKWKNSEDEYFDFRNGDFYILSNKEFVEEDWEPFDDY